MPESDGAAAETSPTSGDVKQEPSTRGGDQDQHPQEAIYDGACESKDNDTETANLIQSQELTPPPLPPRPALSPPGSLRLSGKASRPQLLSKPTTALSLADVHTQSYGENASQQSSSASRSVSRKHSLTQFGRFVSSNSEGDDSASIKSYIPALDVRLENESILGDITGDNGASTWKTIGTSAEQDPPFLVLQPEDEALAEQIEHEFDDDLASRDDAGDEELLVTWKAKLKHFFILSASGKPVYSRHGSDQLISHYIGVVQTLISFYQSASDPLKSFTAGGTRFAMLSKGSLNLVAISRLPESDAQLRSQLEALYMQILSTLTLPSMEKMFSNRPSTDLRRPLQGTDVLLDGLADGFTRGSPSTLLSALECLRLRKTHRKAINDTLLKVRSPNLLYGLIIAAGRLVSVVRPKKHSLHPGDLHLIFNMLFEAGSIRAAGGENWIPLCLPGFNNTGFLYMYVSFFTADADADTTEEAITDNDLAIVLISANKEAFYELRKMRDDLISQLETSQLLSTLNTAVAKGHAPCSEIVPGTVLRHFLYKSRANVQFVQPSFSPHFTTPLARRKLLNLYHQLHESIHSRTAHLKVQHVIGEDATALAWETPLFELYCVSGPNASRAALAQGANKVVQWIRREEERVFIIGGAVF